MAATAATKPGTGTTTTTKPASKAAPKAPKTTLAPDPVPVTAFAPTVPYPQSPVLDMPIAVVVLVANLLIPGAGTLVAGIVGQQKMIGRAIGQFLLIPIILVGWVWALVTSIQCLTNAKRARPASA